MILGLSSATAPDAGLDELLEITARRGFAALELTEGDAHGVSPASGDAALAAVRERAASARVEISGYRVLRAEQDVALARLSRTLAARVLVDGPEAVAGRLERAAALAAAGADAAVVLRGDSAAEDAARAVSAGFPLAWDADPLIGRLGATVESLLRRHADALKHVRLLGGGPEAAMQDGRGVGEMMRRLAVAGYAGTLVLAPSTVHYRVAWRQWLGRRGGWGCGSRSAELPLVNVVPLDVRPVEPKDRFERIMGAYDGLGSDQILELTVDHDPRCMYYTLRATRGDDAFGFEYLEDGPERWRVHVTRRTTNEEA